MFRQCSFRFVLKHCFCGSCILTVQKQDVRLVMYNLYILVTITNWVFIILLHHSTLNSETRSRRTRTSKKSHRMYLLNNITLHVMNFFTKILQTKKLLLTL